VTRSIGDLRPPPAARAGIAAPAATVVPHPNAAAPRPPAPGATPRIERREAPMPRAPAPGVGAHPERPTPPIVHQSPSPVASRHIEAAPRPPVVTIERPIQQTRLAPTSQGWVRSPQPAAAAAPGAHPPPHAPPPAQEHKPGDEHKPGG
jgi:hypothetical protein